MIIERIKAVASDSAAAIVTLVLTDERIEVAATVEMLLDYPTFQRSVLEKSGRVFIFPCAEGRDSTMANYFWRSEVQFHLNVDAARTKKEADTAAAIRSGKASKPN